MAVPPEGILVITYHRTAKWPGNTALALSPLILSAALGSLLMIFRFTESRENVCVQLYSHDLKNCYINHCESFYIQLIIARVPVTNSNLQFSRSYGAALTLGVLHSCQIL